MNKNAIKKFATEARRELISRVSQRALKYGISEKETGNPDDDSVNGHLLSSTEKKQRAALIEQIQEKGYEQVMEEVAYTWFNRFSALRFMEVNNYLPSKVRVFTDEDNAFKPQILKEAIHLELDGLDMEKVYAYKEANDSDELYKYLLITQCNALNSVLPGMFQKIADYTELLFPNNLLREGSVVQQMIELIPEEDWKDQVQIIGWLYQYYNSEKKDDVFAALKKNVKITKENIPAATQLFTPDWIVRYMVENSLGRLWIEGHPNDELKSKWKYYLEEAEQEPDVQAQLASIREEYKALKPEDILCIDPCSGSGHILAYMFDVLVQIYEAYGVDTRTAVASIVENNIYGLDIDDRAAQLAYFSVMMKACQYDKRFLRRKVQPHVSSIVESNHVDPYAVEYFCNGDAKLKEAIDTIIEELHDAKEYGSIITVSQQDWDVLYARFDEIQSESVMSIYSTVAMDLKKLVQVAETLSKKYMAVVTNPPYMAPTEKQKPFLLKKFSYSKNDMAMVFMEQCLRMCSEYGYAALINFPTWMFLSSYERLRTQILNENTLACMVYPGRGIFGSDFGSTCFVMNKNHFPHYIASYNKLFDAIGEVNTVDEREQQFLNRKGQCYFKQSNYGVIPGNPIAFWITDSFLKTFSSNSIGNKSEAKAGIVSGNDEYFLRLWFEVDKSEVTFDADNFKDKTAYKWVPINKGGAFRRYYGNYEYVINIFDLWNCPEKVNVSVRRSEPEYYFRKALTWSSATMGASSFRITDRKTASTAAPCLYFYNEEDLYVALAVLNSSFSQRYLDLLNPTVSLNTSNVSAVPAVGFESLRNVINPLCKEVIKLSKDDWDAFETSWDFERHPLVAVATDYRSSNDYVGVRISECYAIWERKCKDRFERVRSCMTQMNMIIAETYGLSEEVATKVEDKDISIRHADLSRDIRSLISYAVGCMFGRYSLDKGGVIYAGGTLDESKYTSFTPDKDNIIPICSDEYFTDDIVNRFSNFIETVFGKETFYENMKYIASAIGEKGTPSEVIRSYFCDSFYKDHCSVYSGTVGKRPIYWLFDSGKKGAFKALIYMHRYQPDTIARIRTDYVHEQQARYRTAIADLEARVANASTSERVKLNKQLKALNEQAAEIHAYEEKIHHLADQMISIDLDDGVKVNYAKFQDVLAKIK